MDKKEITSLLAILNESFSSKEVSEATVNIWTSCLADIDYKIATTAIQKIIMTSRFFPTIAEIREQCLSVSSGDKPTAVEAWGLIQKAISRFGTYNYNSAMAWLEKEDAIVAELVQKLGWKNICGANVQFVQQNVSKLYNEYRQAIEKESVLPKALTDNIQAIRGKLQGSMLALQGGE